MTELRDLEATRSGAGPDAEEPDGDGDDEGAVDVRHIERSGQVCVLGVPNAGKSSLVNALVGAKVSIVSPKPQTTRQRVLGLALLSPRPNTPPTTQAFFVDTAGIMQVGQRSSEFGNSFLRKAKRLFRHNRLHKAMVKTAWKSTRAADVVFWVLDASKCLLYGDYLPSCAQLDGIDVGPPVRDSWWMHPELDEELAFLRRLRQLSRKVSIILNKIDLLRDMDIDVEDFTLSMRERLRTDLGTNADGEDLLENLWPTSILREPDTLVPLQTWLCNVLPQQSPIYPVESISDVPARVAASEITREKLFHVLREEVPYQVTVVNSVWREDPDGTLRLGQKVVVNMEGQKRIVRGWLRKITQEAEAEISSVVNFGRPVELHFQILVNPHWQDEEEYYSDVQGLLDHSGSLLYPQ